MLKYEHRVITDLPKKILYKTKLAITFNNAMFFLFSILVLFTPLLTSNFTNENYETPKVFFTYFVGLSIIFLFFIMLIIKNCKWTIRRPNFLVLLFFLISLISVLFSTHFYTSVWGYYTRFNDGFMSLIVFVGLYFVALNYLNVAQKRLLLDLTLLTIFPTGIYGMYQIFSGVDRIYSTFGQPNWYAAYLVMLLPLVMHKLVISKQRVFWGVLFLLALGNLIYTVSLSGIAGFVLATSFYIVNFGKKLNQHVVFFLLCILLLFGVFKAEYIKNKLVDAVNLSGEAAQYTLSDPGYVRLGLWKSSIAIMLATPKNFLIGIGPETFPYQLPFYRDLSLNYSSEWNYILNKPHNYYLETFVESGVFAFGVYISLLIWSLLQFNSKGTGLRQDDRKLLVSGLLGFYVTNFFGFPTIYTSLLFWLWIAFLQPVNTDISQ